nr:uncharacterized protein LOC100176017 [Ciona intestinalis]|eukprot:XP_002124609.1 uncharacterized protein LOC100176017 [Ciona intestinalis]
MPAVEQTDPRVHQQRLQSFQKVPSTPNPPASYSNPYPSNRSTKKEPVHLPYKTASPDFTDLPSQHASTGLRADTSYTPRYYGRNRLRGFPMAAYYGADFHIFPPLRHRASSEGRYHKNQQQLPQLSVVPALKHNRVQQRPHAVEIFSIPQPVVVKRVEVSLHDVQQTTKRIRPNSTETQENSPHRVTPEPKPKEPTPVRESGTSFPLKSVDLNKGLNAASAIRKRMHNDAHGAHGTLEAALATKCDPNIVSLSHLPLREVYLRPDPTTGAEQATKRDKTIRILRWLKDLKYLDEKTLQRGRSEVERTRFVLPEIKESVVTAAFT